MMKPLLLPIRERELDSERVVTVMVGTAIIPDFCLRLTLLDRCLVRSVLLSSSTDSNGPGIELRRVADEEIQHRATARWTDAKLVVSLSATELEAWLGFFLRAYRDGEAEVDHLDLDIREGDRLALVLKTDRARPPVPVGEARKILGMAREGDAE